MSRRWRRRGLSLRTRIRRAPVGVGLRLASSRFSRNLRNGPGNLRGRFAFRPLDIWRHLLNARNFFQKWVEIQWLSARTAAQIRSVEIFTAAGQRNRMSRQKEGMMRPKFAIRSLLFSLMLTIFSLSAFAQIGVGISVNFG